MKIKPNKLHLRIGMIFLPFLLVSTITGFFRANHEWFWKENYMKKKRERNAAISIPVVPIDQCMSLALNFVEEKDEIRQLKLKMECGKLFYEIKFKSNHPILIDATTGRLINGLSENIAVAVADQYIESDFGKGAVTFIPNYIYRKEKKAKEVFEVSYNDDLHSKIYIDKYSGEIVEEVDDNRKIIFWMVKLHDYDFWNSKRVILSLVSIGIVSIGMTGLFVWWKSYRKKRKIREIS